MQTSRADRIDFECDRSVWIAKDNESVSMCDSRYIILRGRWVTSVWRVAVMRALW